MNLQFKQGGDLCQVSFGESQDDCLSPIFSADRLELCCDFNVTAPVEFPPNTMPDSDL